jgi:hypothetical protein
MKKAKTDVGPRPTAQQMGGMNSPLGAPHPGGPFIPGNAPLGGGGGVPSTVGLNPGVNPGAPGGGGGSMASPTVDKRGLPPQVAMGNAGVGVPGVVGAPKPPPTVINLTNSAGGIPTPGGGPPPQQQTGGASPVGMPGALQTVSVTPPFFTFLHSSAFTHTWLGAWVGHSRTNRSGRARWLGSRARTLLSSAAWPPTRDPRSNFRPSAPSPHIVCYVRRGVCVCVIDT